MLVLSRRIGETVIIGNNIQITPLSIRGNQIRIGITAPQHVAVHREEIYAKVCKTNYKNLLSQALRRYEENEE